MTDKADDRKCRSVAQGALTRCLRAGGFLLCESFARIGYVVAPVPQWRLPAGTSWRVH